MLDTAHSSIGVRLSALPMTHSSPPRRIVSLVPGVTEMLCLLGLQDRLVAISHECDFPPEIQTRPRVTRSLLDPDLSSQQIDEVVREQAAVGGSTLALDLPLLQSLAPDLIVTQSLCDVCAVGARDVQSLLSELRGPPQLLAIHPHTLDELFAAFLELARATDTLPQAESLLRDWQTRCAAVRRRSAQLDHVPRTLMLEWVDPPFNAGHWTPQLVEWAGGREVSGLPGQPSRRLEWSEITQTDPEVLVVACCGMDLARSRQELPLLRQAPGFHNWTCTRRGDLFLLDGNSWFSRSGPRLIEGLEVLAHTLHPHRHPAPPGVALAERFSADADAR
jgi:iron complex transport system substrate-binding protein